MYFIKIKWQQNNIKSNNNNNNELPLEPISAGTSAQRRNKTESLSIIVNMVAQRSLSESGFSRFTSNGQCEIS